MFEFFDNLTNVSIQVLILFILIAVGFVCGKSGIISNNAAKSISDFCLKFTTPCVIIRSFLNSKLNPLASVSGLLWGLGAAFICHLIAIAFVTFVFRDKNLHRRALFRASSSMCNSGFMGLPLQAALLGPIGEFYGATYVVVMTFFLWTYAFIVMSSGKEKYSIKKAIINPGVISILIGLPLFLFLPDNLVADTNGLFYKVVYNSVNHIANCNTPLPMIIVGFYLSQSNMLIALKDRRSILSVFSKLLFIPLICVGVLYLLIQIGLPMNSMVYRSTIISVSTPIAVAVTMFASKFDGETTLGANMASVSTLLSIITMPIIIAFAMTLL